MRVFHEEVVVSVISHISLLALVIILGVLLYIRHRQLKQARPISDLESILEKLRQNLQANRSDGKIQKIATHLSELLIRDLQADRILFFRRQRRFMEMNYVHGFKSLARSRYRIRITDDLLKTLVSDAQFLHPEQVKPLLNNDLNELLEREQFNLVFPIFWQENLFGVYFINTRLAIDHPIIKTLLLFLNQNLSAAYHITRLESNCQILENKVSSERKLREKLEQKSIEQKAAPETEPDDDPGHLIEMFSHHNVDELVASLFDRVKTGLKAEKLVFLSRPDQTGKDTLRFVYGTTSEGFPLDHDEFHKIYASLEKRRVYPLDHLKKIDHDSRLRQLLESEKIDHLSTFSLSDSEQGLIFWSGKDDTSAVRYRLLNRLESVGRRAILNAREFERVEEMSYTDGLTGLYNHRYFVKRLNEEIKRATRYNRRLGLLLFDIDDFKLYNDNFGHLWGDELLRRMGHTLAQSLRAIDIVARYGGDEFGIIMPEADKSTCSIFMDRLRYAIAATDFRDKANGFEGKITISIGSSIFPDDADTANRLIHNADIALFKSKAMGRNRSTVFTEGLKEPGR